MKVNKKYILNLSLDDKRLHVKYLLDLLYHSRNKVNIILFYINLGN